MPHGVPAQKAYLFTDFRLVLCSDMEWLDSKGAALPLGPTGPREEPVGVTGQMPRGLRLVAQKARKVEAIPATDFLRNRIVFEGGVYRAWGARKQSEKSGGRFEVCYSESVNGIDWKLVHVCPVALPATTDGEGFTVFVDPHGPAAERYKAVVCAEPPREKFAELFEEYKRVHNHHRIWRMSERRIFCMYGLVSADGLNWTHVPGAAGDHLMVQYSDTDTSVYFDEEVGKYVMYTRLLLQQRRWIGRSESDDFRQWSPIQPMIGPGLDWAMTDDVYQNGFCRYPGEEAYYLMFPMVYHRWDQRSEIRLYSSDDGIAWLAVPGGAVLEPGPAGSFDGEFIYVGKDLVPWGKDEIALPYGGTRFPHKYPRWADVLAAPRYGWGVWDRGRLCGLRADQEGYFATFPLEVMGERLWVNAKVPRGGELRVGIVGAEGRSLAECEPVIGDGLEVGVKWKGGEAVGVKCGEAVTLEFRLRAGELFGFGWR